MITPTYKNHHLEPHTPAAPRDGQALRKAKDALPTNATHFAAVHVKTVAKAPEISSSSQHEQLMPQAFQFRDENGVERLDLAAEFEAVPGPLKGFVGLVLQSRHLRFAAEAAYVREAPERHALATAWASSQSHLSNELMQLGLSDLSNVNELSQETPTGTTLNIKG